jgi:hypothetical protein
MHELSEFLHLCCCVLLFLSKTNLPLKFLRRFLNKEKIKLEVKILAENSRRFVLIESNHLKMYAECSQHKVYKSSQ